MSSVLSARAAAARRGVSDRTIRRWIASGRLKADKAAGEFLIDLEDLDALTGHDAAAAAAPGRGPDSAATPDTEDSRLSEAPAAALSADLSGLIALIERQQAQLLERTEAAAMWQERAGSLANQLEAARAEVKALTAPESPQDAPTAPQPPEPTTEPPMSRLRALLPWLVLAIVALVVLLGWPR
jgi:excisionase family DNA binding protein